MLFTQCYSMCCFAYIIIRWILSVLFYRLDNWNLTCPIAQFFFFFFGLTQWLEGSEFLFQALGSESAECQPLDRQGIPYCKIQMKV